MMMSGKTCPKCGAEWLQEDKFCAYCGFKFGDGIAHREDEVATSEPSRIMEAQREITPVIPPSPTPYYQYPGQGYYPMQPAVLMPQKADGLCIASLVFGILAWVVPFAGLLFALLAVIFGASGINRVNSNPVMLSGKGMGIAGLVLGLIGLGIAVLVLILFIGIIGAA